MDRYDIVMYLLMVFIILPFILVLYAISQMSDFERCIYTFDNYEYCCKKEGCEE